MPKASRSNPAKSNAPRKEAPPPAKNREIKVTSRGSLPLQGIKLLVSKAMFRSRGESIIRQPVTPAALQPSPMQVVKACFPQAPQACKHRSRLKAMRGR